MKTTKGASWPRPWWGKNASLRSRLVLLVAVAMLGPGLLSMFQAAYSYRANMRAVRENLEQAAKLAAADEVNVISASREILTSLALQTDIRSAYPACQRTLQRAIAGLDQYVGAAVIGTDGRLLCSTGKKTSGKIDTGRAWFAEVMAGEPFAISDLFFNEWLNDWVIVASVPVLEEGAETVRGAVTLYIGLDWLAGRYQKTPFVAQDAFALLDRSGELIASPTQESTVSAGLPAPEAMRERLTPDGTQTFINRGRDGRWRLYAVSPLLQGRIHVVLGTPLVAAISPLALQFAWGVLAPLLMWALTIGVVWFGIERLVVRWISYLERVAAAYANGQHAMRPNRVAQAPAEIRLLGETFARMADLISAREAELRESLAQKEMLVREIHHRVKNNLQLVMSLLNLHARRIRDPRAEVAFAEARSRINALATLHRRLYESENLQHIEVRWFLEDLCSELRRSGLAAGRNIDLVVDAPAGEVIGPEVAVPLGLLVTEAITNAYKHAFAGRMGGRIEVALVREPDGTFCATVRDDGTGYGALPPPQKDAEPSGLGHSLIEAFARQLRGQLEIQSNGGTLIQVRFPLQGGGAVRETRAVESSVAQKEFS